jgi:uncharacterized protein YfaS (alpha-2-macroglobulin family)
LAPAWARAAQPFFNVSTNRSFAPDEKPRIHLYARNESELEFRVYHVQDPEKFVAGLQQLHSFGEGAGFSPVEQIDEETWLERFHDWKRERISDFRQFMRTQLSHDTREALEAKQSSLARRSRVINVAEFAQIPILNDKQLVARWRQEVPPTFVSDNQILPIDPLPAGMYLVEVTDAHLKAYTILLVSQTALVTRTVGGSMLTYVVDRKSGAPVAGSQVALSTRRLPAMHAVTDSDGVAEFQAPPKPTKANGEDDDSDASSLWAMARSGSDVALVAPWGSSFALQTSARFASYVYTDRPVYRPGHTVHWKAIVRQYQGDALQLPKLTQTHVVINDEQGKAIFDKQLPVSAMGTLDGQVELPQSAALGYYIINVGDEERSGLSARGQFHVEDYRKPEYQVRVSAAKARVLQGENNQVTIDSRYFFGEPVANAKVTYRVFQSAHYWWGDEEDGADNSGDSNADSDADSSDNADADDSGDQEAEQTGRLDSNGKLTINVPTRFIEKQHYDKDYVVQGAVTDDAGREITGRYKFLATYGTYRIHVEPVSYSVQKGQTATFRINAVDYDNKPVSVQIHLRLTQSKWQRGEKTEPTIVGNADATTGADGNGRVDVPINVAGSVTVTASSDTPEHRTVQDTTWLWVSGPQELGFDDRTQQVQIIPDKKSYAPGDTAHIAVIGETPNFHALVTATGYTREFRKVLTAQGTSLTVDLPITKDSQPNLSVEVVFVQNDQLYQAQKSLKVPPTEEQLDIEITPAANVFQPGQTAVYDVTARDSKGQPVKAELSFGVVDEAIYSIYPDSSGDIVKALYPDRYNYADVESSLSYFFSGEAGTKSPTLAQRAARFHPQLAQVKPGNDTVQPKVRKAFPDTAFWQPAVQTDAQGHARVSLNFPDSLTTWRATVRAVTADSKAGSTINRVIVRKNIIVRMGQPRFLRKGDTVSVPVIVHNYLQTAKQVTLSLDASGVEIVGGATQQIAVAARGETSAIWKLHATAVGTATLTAKALTNEESDALQITLPVHPAGVAQTINMSGTLSGNGDRGISINFPASSDPAAHSLTVDMSPSIAGTLFNALDYLTTFPYGCTEQTMSSFLPNIIVTQALKQLNLKGKVDQTTLSAKIAAGIERLKDYQHEDGGWGWWKEDQSQVFMTAYVVSGLAQAQEAGYEDAAPPSANGVTYLQGVLKKHPRMLPELRAYVVYALAQANQTDKAQLDNLWSRRSDLSAQGLAFTGLAMLRAKDNRAADIGKLLESRARVEGELASWPSAENPLLDIETDSSAQSTALALKLLAHTDPQNPLLVKAAQWLVANRDQGYWWSSTEQTAFVIYGLTDYLVNSKELSFSSDVEVFVNGVSVGKRHFTQEDAVSGDSLHITMDAAHLQPQQNQVRVIVHGPLANWSAQGGYFSTDKKSYQKGSMSLNIARDYFRLVQQQTNGNITYKLEPLQGPVQQGDVLAVHIGVSGSPQKYLLMEDPIPAGAEFVQHEETYNIVDRPSEWGWWYTRREFRDDRAAIFADELDKRQESFYLLKVVNAGSFTISPASIQPMYQPGVQATTDEQHLDVKETP